MTRIMDLLPGQHFAPTGVRGLGLNDRGGATFIAQTHHPIWPALNLVIWRMDNGDWSHDALDPRQELPTDPEPADDVGRMNNLRTALLGKP